MLTRFVTTFLALLALPLTGLAAETPTTAPGAAPATQPARAVLSKVLADLNAEATTAYRQGKNWPRTTANYALESGKTLDRADLIRVLSRRLHATPAIEAYVKWQLLSFGPDLSQASAEDLHRIVAVLPEFTYQPDLTASAAARGASGGGGAPGMNVSLSMAGPPGGFGTLGQRQTTYVAGLTPVPGTGLLKPTLGVVNSGMQMDVQGTVSADQRYVTLTTQLSNANLVELRQVAQFFNVPVVALRDNLTSQLPEAGGVRFAALLEDVKHRIRAGEPSYPAAVNRLVKQMQMPLDRASLPPAMQRQLVGGVRELARLRTPVVKSVEESPAGKIVIVRETVLFPREHLPALMRYVGVERLVE